VPEALCPPAAAGGDTRATMTALPRSIDRTDRGHDVAEPAAAPRPPAVEGRVARVLLATDLRPTSSSATAAAIRLARDTSASLVVVNVVEPPRGGRFALRIDQVRERNEAAVRAIAEEAREAGVQTAFLVWEGDPGPSVVAAAEAERADIIVLGSSARPRVTRLLLGSVSEHVLQTAPCPVLVVRPDET
jgi:nucleotide-binding universal stress UspA family protein